MISKNTCLIAMLCAFFVYCSNSKKQVRKEESIKGELPGYTSLEFIEDLKISREDRYPTGLEIDAEGNIYAFEVDFAKVFVYDKNGNALSQKEFKQGQGPGDINFMDSIFSLDGNLYIFDKTLGRLTIFNKEWDVLGTRELRKKNKDPSFIRLDSRNSIYGWTLKEDVRKGKYFFSVALAKFSQQGKSLREIFEYRDLANFNATYDTEKNIQYIHLYPPYGTFKLDSEDFVYYAVSDKYEINIVSPQGEPVRKITKQGKTRKVTGEDTEDLISMYKKASSRYGRETGLIIPDHMPAIADFFVFENKYVLVVTYENPMNSPTLKGDLFDDKGNFLSNVEVPKYWQWYYWGVRFKKNAIYKKNHFYIIEHNEDEDSYTVKRYRMVWN